MASEQAAMVGSIEEYLAVGAKGYAKYATGEVMCVLSIMCWYLSVCKELCGCLNYILGLFGIPRGRCSRLDPHDEGENALVIASLSWARYLWGYILVSMRITVSVFSLLYGATFLAFTVSMQDMLLNAVALEFVMMIDELVFEALAPVRARNLIAKLAPVKMKQWPQCAGADIKALCFLVATFVFSFWVYFSEVVPQKANLQTAWDYMCANNTDFIYAVDPLNMTWVKVGTPEFDGETSYLEIIHSQGSRAIEEALYDAPTAQWQEALLSDSFQQLKGAATISLEDTLQLVRGEVTSCSPPLDDLFEDPDNQVGLYATETIKLLAQNRFQVWKTQMARWSAGNSTNATTCADLANYCYFQSFTQGNTTVLLDDDARLMTLAVRAWCPGMCGCAQPVSGTVLTSPEFGCPTVCTTEDLFLEAASNVTCPAADSTGPATGNLLVWVDELPELAANVPAWTGIADALRDTSCAALSLPSLQSSNLCGAFGVTKPFLAMCPDACSCRVFDSDERPAACPNSCYSCVDYMTDAPAADPVDVCNFTFNWSHPQAQGDAQYQMTFTALNTDALCCHLMEYYVNATMNHVFAHAQDAASMHTMCTPCRKSTCVETALQQASVLAAPIGVSPTLSQDVIEQCSPDEDAPSPSPSLSDAPSPSPSKPPSPSPSARLLSTFGSPSPSLQHSYGEAVVIGFSEWFTTCVTTPGDNWQPCYCWDVDDVTKPGCDEVSLQAQFQQRYWFAF